MQQTEKFSYPIGPNVRNFLGIAKGAYLGDVAADLSAVSKMQFINFFASALSQVHALRSDDLGNIMDELLAMDMPQLNLNLAEKFHHLVDTADFRVQFALGCSAMLVNELNYAVDAFVNAYKANSQEPAPYTNLSRIFFAQDDFALAIQWARAGLQIEKNNIILWEVLAAALQKTKSAKLALEELQAHAKELQSWAGISLLMSLKGVENSLKLSELEAMYRQGEVSHDFLVEFTALLGQCEQYEKLLTVYWKAKHSASDLSWKLTMHAWQAFTALEKANEAQDCAAILMADATVPEDVKSLIQENLS